MRFLCNCTILLLLFACPSSPLAESKLFEGAAVVDYIQFESQDDVHTAILARAEQQVFAAIGQYIAETVHVPHVILDNTSFMGVAAGIFAPEIASLTIGKSDSGYNAAASVVVHLDTETLKTKVDRFVDSPVYFPNAVSGRVQVQDLLTQLDALELELTKAKGKKDDAGLYALKKKAAYDTRATLLRLRALTLNDRVIRKGEKGLHKDPRGIMELLNRAIDYDKSNPWLFMHRGRAHSLSNNPTAAMGDYKRAIAIDPYSPQAFYFRGLLYNSIESWDAAIVDFNASISLDLNFEWSYVRRGIARREIGKFVLSLRDFDRAALLNPENPQTFNEKGLTYHRMKLYKNAIDDFTRATRIAPDLAVSYVNKGAVRMEMGSQTAACEDWRKACELGSCEKLSQSMHERICISRDPSAAVRWSKKSYEHVSNSRWKDTIVAATLAISHDPGLISSYINRGWAFAEIQEFNRALDDCDKAISLDPKSAAAYNNRGFVKQKKGDIKNAGKDYLKACSLGLKIGCSNYLEVKKRGSYPN